MISFSNLHIDFIKYDTATPVNASADTTRSVFSTTPLVAITDREMVIQIYASDGAVSLVHDIDIDLTLPSLNVMLTPVTIQDMLSLFGVYINRDATKGCNTNSSTYGMGDTFPNSDMYKTAFSEEHVTGLNSITRDVHVLETNLRQLFSNQTLQSIEDLRNESEQNDSEVNFEKLSLLLEKVMRE